jgi:phosphonate transport system substrate-binding protein
MRPDRDARHRPRLDDEDRRSRRRAVEVARRSEGQGPRARQPRQRAEGLVEGKTYRSLRFNSDVGKHGDTGTSEVEALRAVLDGRADAAAIGSPFWDQVRAERLAPEGALVEIWTSEPFNHCMFTARPGLDPELSRRFAEALDGMSYENPAHRPVLEAEGLKRWVKPHLDGYASLKAAAGRQGFFERQPL